MSNYIFLTKRYNDDEPTYYAISPEKIETLPLWSTRGDYGQLVGHYDAGDYHMDNSASEATLDCKKAIAEKFAIELHNIHLVEYTSAEFEIEAGDGEQYGFDEEAVNLFIAEWRKENESLIEVKGFTYWDGHNHKSVLVEAEYFDTNYEIVDDAALVAALNNAIEEKKFTGEGFGKKLYTANGWTVEDNYCQGVWDEYRVYSAEVEQD